jgi:hypothetical protein
VADPLDLLTDVELGGVEVDQFPGEPEDFALAQAQDQDQDGGGMQCFLVMRGGFEELAGFVNAPPATLARAWCWQTDDGGRLTLNQHREILSLAGWIALPTTPRSRAGHTRSRHGST